MGTELEKGGRVLASEKKEKKAKKRYRRMIEGYKIFSEQKKGTGA